MKTLKNVEKYSSRQKQSGAYLNASQNVTLPGSSQRAYRRIGNLNGTPVPKESRVQPAFYSTSGSQGEQSSFSKNNRRSNCSRGAISVINHAGLRDKDITPQSHSNYAKRRHESNESPIKDQINSHIGSIQQSTTSIPAEKSPISSNFNRAALLKLKESIDNKSTGSASNSALAFNQNIAGSEERQQLSNERPRRQTINLAKLSMVLKTQGKLNVSHKM